MSDLNEEKPASGIDRSAERHDDTRRQPVLKHANLEGLRRALLAPRAIVRDENGWLTHPAFPACDEDVRADRFLAAFGIESAFVSMESEVDIDAFDRHLESGDFNCGWWNPTMPAGEGWQLLEIYDTDAGPYALFAREKQHETRRARLDRDACKVGARPIPIDAAKVLPVTDSDVSEGAGGDVPAAVLAALDRMCTPLHESVLDGATAAADSHSMQVIREYVLGGHAGAPSERTASASDPIRDPRVTKMATFMFRMISALRRTAEWKGLAGEALGYLTEIGLNKTYRIATRPGNAAVAHQQSAETDALRDIRRGDA
ncbi:hypothetical protein [Burkholderia pyrrocinia]|uniref:hypothetical protein n=1 Tax=Burkholderia pyrrocinia TaxID=60550 RepID=UPI001053EBB5|nr:hypothetical protein [Burkholderia pyrrocinia]TDA45567.1 hypothetical protein EVG18_20715 [Burkholderia pyrrocinia]